MTVKKLHYLMIVLLGVTVCSCQKDPSTSSLHRDYMVYTAYDTGADFAKFTTYYLPDSILLIGTNDKTEYWKDADAQQIISTVADNLDAMGYTRIDQKEEATLGMQLSYVKQVTYFVGSTYPYWWWYYPYYWTPGYWGDWGGWHYPYEVYYGYTAGSMLMEIVDLTAEQESGKKLPVVWNSFIGGLLNASQEVNQQRTVDAVDQAFEQSPYLNI